MTAASAAHWLEQIHALPLRDTVAHGRYAAGHLGRTAHLVHGALMSAG